MKIFDAAEYLTREDEIEAYLAEARSENDKEFIAVAEATAARARERLCGS